MKNHKWLLFLLCALLVCIPVLSVRAQEPPPPQYDYMDDDFINALVVMSVNNDILSGSNEVGNLTALYDIVGEYYKRSLDSDSLSSDERQRITEMQNHHLSMIGNKVVRVRRGAAKNWLLSLLDIFTSVDWMKPWNPDQRVDENETDPRRLVADDDNLPETTTALENAVIWTDAEKTTKAFVLMGIVSAAPSLAPSSSDSSGWSYNVPAITDSSSGIPSIGGTDSSETQNGSDNGNEDQASSIGPSDTQRKPLRFINNGYDSVTVVVQSYEPAPGMSSGIPTASTVVSPGSNSSAYLDLPLGTYTFCYYWQLDQDSNNDDYFDYHHGITGTYTLNNSSSDNMQSAAAVALNPEGIVSNPNGKCDEVFLGDGSSLDLTQEEMANQGTHTYASVCYDSDLCDDEIDYFEATITFSNGGVVFEAEGEREAMPRTGTNTYTQSGGDAYGTVYTYVFTMEGFETTVNTMDVRLVNTRQD